MIRAVLLDLDDTLIDSQPLPLFKRYLAALGEYCQHLAPSEDIAQHVMRAYTTILSTYDPSRTLAQRFYEAFCESIGSHDDLSEFFAEFYASHYPAVARDFVRPHPAAAEILSLLAEQNLRVVIATNPGSPSAATLHRMQRGGLSPSEYSLELITTFETMHFGKPQPEYYEEILLRLDVESSEAIMVGDDWDHDIAPAMAIGMHTFWITADSAPPEGVELPDGWGTLEQFAERVRAGWLENVPPRSLGHQALIGRLAAFPAAIAATIQGYTREVLECAPDDQEWSARDIICHLRDHDAEEDRRRLERILEQDNPFLSANYDPWAHAHVYADTPVDQALRHFVRSRASMVSWLKGVPAHAWNRPARNAIFGPTTFEEMVRFATEHDRTHLRQLREAIAYAVTVCGVP